jgi:putative ABC transport system substrate-binding protein
MLGWRLGASAQQRRYMRRIGVLMNLAEDNPQGQARFAALLQGQRELGWIDGQNVRLDTLRLSLQITNEKPVLSALHIFKSSMG